MALGKGDLDFNAYFQALQEIGYNGYLTIEREVREQPVKDIGDAVQFLQSFKK